MADAAKFDLLLFGFRNDLARERSILYLRSLPPALRPETRIDRDTPLPCRALGQIDHEIGLQLCAELRRLGSQVRLVATDVIESPPPPTPQRSSWFNGRLATALVLTAVAAAYLRSTPQLRQLERRTQEIISQTTQAVAPEPLQKAFMPEEAAPETYALNNAAIELSHAGDFPGAAQQFREAMARDPDDSTLRRNFQNLMQQWSVTELNAGRTTTAADIALDGLDYGEDVFLLQVLGLAHARNQDSDRAQQVLERALELGARDPNTYVTLGRIYRQQGERQHAAAMFQLAREHGAGGPDFERVLGQVERELDAEWDFSELTSPHFTVAFDQGENYSAARLVMAGLEDAYQRVGSRLDYYPQERGQVVLYTSEEFHDITQAPSWMGALYDGRIKIPVHGLDADTAMLDRTLRHEYAHVVVSQLSRNRCPVWLSEGVALWSEEDRDGAKTAWAQAAIAGQPLFHLRDLEGKFTGLAADRVQVAYAQSYLAFRALIDEYGSRRLRELLVALADEKDFRTAFDKIYRRDFATFEGNLLRDLTG